MSQKNANTNSFKKGYGATPAKAKPVFHNRHNDSPMVIITKNFNGESETREQVRPGVYRVRDPRFLVEDGKIGWDTAQKFMDFKTFAYWHGGDIVEMAKLLNVSLPVESESALAEA